MPKDQNLVLVRATVGRSNSTLADDVYDVWDDNAKVVGRVYRATITPPERPWFWTITVRALQRPTELGYAATREDALAALKQAWHSRSEK